MQKRSHQIVVHVTTVEKQRIEKAAADKGQSVNMFMVVAALEAVERTPSDRLDWRISPEMHYGFGAVKDGPKAFHEVGRRFAMELHWLLMEPEYKARPRLKRLRKLLLEDDREPVVAWLEENLPEPLETVPEAYFGFFLAGMKERARAHILL